MAAQRPNILVLMADQLRADAVFVDGFCRTPNLRALMDRGLSFSRAYTPNPVCSPARASLMTGKLPHNHDVFWVTHTVNEAHGTIRKGLRHFVQDLSDAGYRSAYVGKWHVETTERPSDFGWDVDISMHSPAWKEKYGSGHGSADALSDAVHIDGPPGYNRSLLCGVTREDPGSRMMGHAADEALALIDRFHGTSQPWCVFASVTEPHDPYIAGRSAYDACASAAWRPPAADYSVPGTGVPFLYKRASGAFAELTDAQKRHAALCYAASVMEIDGQFGRILNRLEELDIADNTLVVLVSDHGDFLGAHGMYCKNVGAWEEAYHIPLVVAGPGIGCGVATKARVGSHQLFPSILDFCGIPSRMGCDGPLCSDVLRASGPAGAAQASPAALEAAEARHRIGFAENHGSRFLLTQRVYYQDQWKLVMNGFDQDELYDLESDPRETRNLVPPAGGSMDRDLEEVYRELYRGMWKIIKETGDHTLVNSHYQGIRSAAYGPGV